MTASRQGRLMRVPPPRSPLMLPRKTLLTLALGLIVLALATASTALSKSPPPSPSPSPSPSGAKATFTPSTLTFAPQDVGTTSPSQVITLKNTGTSGLFINGEQ